MRDDLLLPPAYAINLTKFVTLNAPATHAEKRKSQKHQKQSEAQ